MPDKILTDSKTNKYKILIVDDVPKNIQVVASILQNQGYSMAFAQDGPTALEQAGSNAFDLILLDIMMPGMDGFEVCRQLRMKPASKDVPVLFLTAKTETESIVNGFEAGAMDYVIKPVNESELLARVKTHLELYRSRKELIEINQRLNEEIKERRNVEYRFRRMYENAVQGMFQSTFSGKVTNLNPAYARILGYESPEEVLNIENVTEAFYDDPQDRIDMINALQKKGIITNYELRIKRKDGVTGWIMVNARLTSDTEGEKMIEGIVIDHTARKKAEEKLKKSREVFRYQAIHDNLTGLYNTRYLYHALEELVKNSAKKESSFSLIFMDVDDFKKVVDFYGHLKGSQTLKELAGTIKESLEEPAYGVAYGGDEFVVVLPDFDKEQAVQKAEELRAKIRSTSYLTSHGHNVNIRASLGIASYPEDAKDTKGLLALADQAMFDVKDKGKDAVLATHGVSE